MVLSLTGPLTEVQAPAQQSNNTTAFKISQLTVVLINKAQKDGWLSWHQGPGDSIPQLTEIDGTLHYTWQQSINKPIWPQTYVYMYITYARLIQHYCLVRMFIHVFVHTYVCTCAYMYAGMYVCNACSYVCT